MNIPKIPVDDFWVLGMPGSFALVARQASPDYAALGDGQTFATPFEPQVELRISAQTAKALLATLAQAIGRYEEACGPIRMPEQPAAEARH